MATEHPDHFQPRVAENGKVIGWKVHRFGEPDYDEWPPHTYDSVAAARAAVRAGPGPELNAKTVHELHRRTSVVTPENLEVVRKAACPHLPADAQARKDIPLATGLLDYFPDALAAVAALSARATAQHHPGQPHHWDRTKSADEADTLMRHFLDRGTLDTDGQRHSTKVAWRALALLQKEIEADRQKE